MSKSGSNKRNKVSFVFWSSVGVVVISFAMAVYTAMTNPEKDGPELVKPSEDTSLPLPATPDSM